MKKEQIYLWDLERIFLGQTPPEFLLEVFIRSLIVFIAAITIARYLGKRMNGQLTIIEMSVMVMMGAILSVPMQLPDRGIVPGLLVLICTLLLLRGINWLGYQYSSFEKKVQGEVALLVKDGVLQLPQLQHTKIPKQKLYSILRNRNIYHLGKVKRMYIEACGTFSIYKEESGKPGLPVIPPNDPGLLQVQREVEEQACCNCGTLIHTGNTEQGCPNCGSNDWTKAIV